jgi:hypothetical protein
MGETVVNNYYDNPGGNQGDYGTGDTRDDFQASDDATDVPDTDYSDAGSDDGGGFDSGGGDNFS